MTTFSVSFDPDRKAWAVTSSDPAFEPEFFDTAEDAEQFAADMRRVD